MTLAAAAALLTVLAACSGGGGLSGGLTARMDQPGATLNRAEALGLINDYRRTTGAGSLAGDAGLDTAAQAMALDYARTGNVPGLPDGTIAVRVSAGYANFAETFSGWRNSPPDAQVLSAVQARRAGLGVTYEANSAYGVYWVIVLDD